MVKLTLEQRLEALEAIDAIKRLKYEYCRICDTGFATNKIAELFTEDGVWEMGPNDRNVGREGIIRKFAGLDETLPFASHMVMNPIIEVNGDVGHGQWWVLSPSTRKEGNKKYVGYWLAGIYDEEYRLIEGVWKFKRMSVDLKFWSPHLEDWALQTIKPT